MKKKDRFHEELLQETVNLTMRKVTSISGNPMKFYTSCRFIEMKTGPNPGLHPMILIVKRVFIPLKDLARLLEEGGDSS